MEIFTDEGDVVIDPCAGSGATLRACKELKRNSYGFEISKEFYKRAVEEMLPDLSFAADKQTGQINLLSFPEIIPEGMGLYKKMEDTKRIGNNGI